MGLWTPASIATSLWLDASDPNTVLFTNPPYVVVWADAAGGVGSAVQWNDGMQPELLAAQQNGLDVLAFDGIDDYFRTALLIDLAAGLAGMTIFAAGADLGGGPVLVASTAGSVSYARAALIHGAGYQPTASGRRLDTDTTQSVSIQSASGWGISMARFDWAGATLSVGANGVITALAGSFQTAGISDAAASSAVTVGGWMSGETLAGQLGEIVVVPWAVNSALRQVIEGYLAHKWGVADGLPADHPYKATAPPDTASYMVAVRGELEQQWGYTLPVRGELMQSWGIKTGAELVQLWGDAPQARGALDQAWAITGDAVRGELAQVWGIKTGAELAQPWGDAPQARSVLHQPWSDAARPKVSSAQVWKSYLQMRSNLNQLWASLSRTQIELLQKWAVANSSVSNTLDISYDIREVSGVRAGLSQQYWLTGNTQVSNLSSQYVSVDGEVIYPVSISLKSSIDQYAITASIELASQTDLDKFTVGRLVTLHGCLNTVFTFIVDDYGYDLAFDSDSFKVELVSPAATLDSPYSELITGEYSGLASSICSTIAGSIALSWNTVDWFIDESILSVNEDSPLSVIRRVVNEIGSRVQSTPSGEVSIISRYPFSCNVWETQAPVVEINKATQVISEQYTYEQVPGYNNFSIGNDDISDSILRIEVEEVSSSSKLIKVFVYPDTPPTVSHSGNSSTVNLTYNGPVIDSVSTQVEFVGGEGSVNGPISLLQSYVWRYRDLGSVTYEPTGVMYASVGDSLMDLTYRTKFYSYTINTSILEDIQIIVEADV